MVISSSMLLNLPWNLSWSNSLNTFLVIVPPDLAIANRPCDSVLRPVRRDHLVLRHIAFPGQTILGLNTALTFKTLWRAPNRQPRTDFLCVGPWDTQTAHAKQFRPRQRLAVGG